MSVVARSNDDDINLCKPSNTTDSSSAAPLVLRLRLQEALNACSNSIEAEDHRQTENAVATLVEFINSVRDATISNSEDSQGSEESAVEVLTELLRFVSSPSLDQTVVDALSFDFPKTVAKFAALSDKCRDVAECIIDCFISKCSPRDMLSVLCEALDSPSEMFKAPAYFAPLLSGLSKVFLCIQRRHFEQIKEAVPIILNVLKAASSESDDEDRDTVKDLIGRTINIATSIQEVCQKLGGGRKQELCALLGLFVLQIMALVSSSLADRDLSCIPIVSQLSHFLPFCDLSYLGLITGCDVEAFTSTILGGDAVDSDDCMSCFSLIKHGASLAVIWGHISHEVVKAAKEDLDVVKDKLRISQTKRWQALGMLKYVLSSIDQPWQLKKHAIHFLLCIMGGNISQNVKSEYADCSLYVPSLFAVLQAIEKVIIYASDTVLRKNAFASLKVILADIPTYQRFDILKALITNNSSSSMIGIYIGLVKEEMLMENCQNGLPRNDEFIQVENKIFTNSQFWSSNVLDFVELVLKPTKGGPPSLPEQSDAVLSALNLYRFIFIAESAGKTNYTGVLSESTLRKSYMEWLLPLRTLVTGIMAENEKDYSQFAVDTICALNPIQLVLYRCIELVEEKLHHST